MGQPNGKKRILIVEDDESISLGLRMNLEAEGYDVEVATDGEDGLARALTGGADLVILDVMLPKVNGFEVLRLIRQPHAGVRPVWKTPPTVGIIVLSGAAAGDGLSFAARLGADACLTKPFDVDDVLAAVNGISRSTR